MDTNSGDSTSGKSDEAVQIGALRSEIARSLIGARQRLEKGGLSAVFVRAAKSDPVGDMGFLSHLVIQMALGGAFSDFIDFHGIEGDNHISLSAASEGLFSLGWEESDPNNKNKSKLSAYPKGRRKNLMKENRMSKKFNRAANQNSRISTEAGSDLAYMFGMQDTLDGLEKKSASASEFDKKRPVYILPKKDVKKPSSAIRMAP